MAQIAEPLCTQEERWNEGDVYAVRKNGATKATQLYREKDLGRPTAQNQALSHAQSLGAAYSVEFRLGESKRCNLYCDAAPWCTQWANDPSNPLRQKLSLAAK